MKVNQIENEIWFITGSQHLYGPETLAEVDKHSKVISSYYAEQNEIPIHVLFKPVLKSPDEILQLVKAANHDDKCIGLIIWMHTFSPAKMWIAGLSILNRPFLHLHTQYNDEIPWSSINMDFMNLNQSAHGGREFGFIASRMRMNRKIVVGHWQDEKVVQEISRWTRVAAGWSASKSMKVARIGDNMREVAVTEGNKVSAQIKFGYSVNGFGIGDLTAFIDQVSQKDIEDTITAYESLYTLTPSLHKNGEHRSSLEEAARIEVGLRAFLEDGGFTAFTDTFENLHGLRQLPGIAVQRLMAEGYGFGAEGDWKTAALVRTMKVMGQGLTGGNSFMEDYTYHFSPKSHQVLGSHMLEICPSIADSEVKCAIHPLGIGGKEDPVRLIFNAAPGSAINASVVDMGNRFRLIINEVEAIKIKHDMDHLPVARVLWDPAPSLKVAAHAWILAAGAHHTCYSQNVSTQDMIDFAEMADIECLVIDANTDIRSFKQDMRTNEVFYHLNNGFN